MHKPAWCKLDWCLGECCRAQAVSDSVFTVPSSCNFSHSQARDGCIVSVEVVT